MIASGCALIVATDGRDGCASSQIDGPALDFGFPLELGIEFDNPFHRVEYTGKGLLQVVG